MQPELHVVREAPLEIRLSVEATDAKHLRLSVSPERAHLHIGVGHGPREVVWRLDYAAKLRTNQYLRVVSKTEPATTHPDHVLLHHCPFVRGRERDELRGECGGDSVYSGPVAAVAGRYADWNYAIQLCTEGQEEPDASTDPWIIIESP